MRIPPGSGFAGVAVGARTVRRATVRLVSRNEIDLV
jgi:hypothetical protein